MIILKLPRSIKTTKDTLSREANRIKAPPHRIRQGRERATYTGPEGWC
jgi:hypothetical protein